ncbi:hypothetical protein JCM33374_g2929 [Metschnikowia sp. JCM 33374]|nr:hypothetical protein JCM33374_g2929 [Metschnikowia sp. JCM 33374]
MWEKHLYDWEAPLVPATDMMNMHMALYGSSGFSASKNGGGKDNTKGKQNKTQSKSDSDSDSSPKPPAFIEPRFVDVFHNFKTSQRSTYLAELSQQDPAIQIYWANNAIREKLKLMTVQSLDASKRNDVVKAASRHFGPLFLSSNRLSRSMTRTQLSMYGHALGFTFNPTFSENDTFQVSLRKLMPRTKPVLEAYLGRFFAKIYPLYPVVDERWLFAQVTRLLNYPGPKGEFQSANLTSRQDVITVAMVLIILRLSAISAHAYRTKLPTFNAESSNLVDLDLEKTTVSQLGRDYEIFSAGNTILNLALDTISSFTTASFVQHLSDFEKLIKDKLGVIDDFFMNNASRKDQGIFTVAKIRIFLCLRIFVSYANYFLYLYYRCRKNQKLSFFFLKKTISLYINEFGHLCSELMFCQERYFDNSFALVMTPLIMVARSASFMVSSAISMSLECGIIVSRISNDKHRDVHLMRVLLQKSRYFTLQVQKTFKLLSERYFYAWRYAKINSDAYKSLLDLDFYVMQPKTLSQAAILYTDDQILELIGCIRETCPLEITDAGEFQAHSYQTLETGNDSDLEGVDLYKTLQTENFWIVLNTLAEREYISQYLTSEQTSASPEATSSDQASVTTVVQDNGPTRSTPSLLILDPTTNAAHLEPSTLQVLDMNLFTNNWNAEDTFNA